MKLLLGLFFSASLFAATTIQIDNLKLGTATSTAANPATAGTLRLPYAALLDWRNSTNAANLSVGFANSSGGFLNYFKLSSNAGGIDLNNVGSVSNPGILIADDSGFYRRGANAMAAGCGGTKCMDLALAQVGFPAFFYLNVAGTAATTDTLATNSTSDKLILAGDPFGDLTRGGAFELGARAAAIGEVINVYAAGTKVLSFISSANWKSVAGNESTGAGAALLGANSPASTLTAPYTWEKVITSDGSTGYFPVWK